MILNFILIWIVWGGYWTVATNSALFADEKSCLAAKQEIEKMAWDIKAICVKQWDDTQ